MELGKYIKKVLEEAKKNKAGIVEFDIGVCPYGDGTIRVERNAPHRIKFGVWVNQKKAKEVSL